MIKRTAKLFKYLLQFVYYKSLKGTTQYYDVIYQAVQDLGGVYVKLIQFICLRTDIFPDDQKLLFLGFYDEVPIEKLPIQDILKNELGPEKLNSFLSIDDAPFASGTFGQVYKAKLQNGLNVVIKIKRKDLVVKLAVDFLLLKIFARVFNLLYYQRFIDVNNLVSEFQANTYEELDYVKEAQNAEHFYKIYFNHPHLFVPKTYLELTTQNVLVQEYVGGISVTELIRLKAENKDQEYRNLMKNVYHTDMLFIIDNLAFELGMQAFNYDIFYADPHPGNLKILPNNRYALIDFGIVGISPKNRRNYYNIIKLMICRADDFDMKGIGKEFLQWGAHKFYKDIQLLDDHFSQDDKRLSEELLNKYVQLLDSKREKFKEIEVRETENFVQIYLDVIRTGQFLNVKVPLGFLAAMKTVAIYKAWNSFLEPTYHHMRQTYQDIVQNVNESKLLNEEEAKDSHADLEGAIENVLDWIGKVAETDVPFYNRLASSLKDIAYV